MGRAGLLEVSTPQPLVCTLDADLLVSFPAHSDNIPRGECPVGGRTVALWGAGLALLTVPRRSIPDQLRQQPPSERPLGWAPGPAR